MAFDGQCLIRRAGITPEGLVQLDLKAVDGTFEWNWFIGKPEQTREILAIALAAVVADKKVYCQMDDPTVAWSQVYRFGIAKY